jgi:hypothetical protein
MQDTGKGPTPPLRLGLVQFKPRKADVAGNLEMIRERWIPEAADTDILVFPETALTGYFLEGGVVDVAQSAEEVARGLGVPGKNAPNVILGFYEKWRRGIYNSVACFEPGEDGYHPIHVHRKLFLPTLWVHVQRVFLILWQRSLMTNVASCMFGMTTSLVTRARWCVFCVRLPMRPCLYTLVKIPD